MRKIVLRVLVNSLCFILAPQIFPSIHLDNAVSGLMAGIILTIINLVIRPILILITIPFNLVTLGALTLFINTWMVMLADKLVPGLQITGFWLTFIIALLISLANMAFKGAERKN